MAQYFIAGTDTGVGKTSVTCALLREAITHGKNALGLKPVAAGAHQNAQGEWQNEDAQALMQASNISQPYERVNPLCLKAALSPHIAAQQEGHVVDLDDLVDQCRKGLALPSDLTLVEGAGGWRVPIGENITMANLAVALGLPVILVVGMRLGCLNHALLTVEAICADGLDVYGWVANHIDPNMQAQHENVSTLEELIDAPRLTTFPYQTNTRNENAYIGADIMKLFAYSEK